MDDWMNRVQGTRSGWTEDKTQLKVFKPFTKQILARPNSQTPSFEKEGNPSKAQVPSGLPPWESAGVRPGPGQALWFSRFLSTNKENALFNTSLWQPQGFSSCPFRSAGATGH